MKVALCLSGHLRSFRQTFYSLHKYIIEPYNPDIFIFTYENKGFDGDRGDRAAINQLATTEELDNLYHPIKCVITRAKKNHLNMIKYKDRVGSGVRDATIIPSMFHSVYRANLLKTEYEQEIGRSYDVVIRSRPDILYETPLDKNEFENCMTSNAIYIPTFGNYGGYNDQFAFGSSLSMDLYSSTFPNIDTFFDLGCLFHAETLCKYTLDYYDIPIVRSNMNYKLQRSNGTFFRNADN